MYARRSALLDVSDGSASSTQLVSSGFESSSMATVTSTRLSDRLAMSASERMAAPVLQLK